MTKAHCTIGVVKSSLLAATTLLTVLLAIASAAPATPAQRVSFSKAISDPTPQVGEIVTFTLNFNSTAMETQTIQIRVTDPNPAPAYLDIITSSITGGAIYSSTIDAVVWEGTLHPGGTLPHVVAFQVQATGIPSAALSGGFLVTNAATMIDLATPGSLPEMTAEAAFRIMPLPYYLPIVCLPGNCSL